LNGVLLKRQSSAQALWTVCFDIELLCSLDRQMSAFES